MPSDTYRPAGFFALRTPLLPLDELDAWSRDLEAAAATSEESRAAALRADRERLRRRLRRLLARREIREALFLASPALDAGLAAWHHDPESKKGQRAERAVVRYLYRMAARATPFGLFSGCSHGRLAARTRLRLAPRDVYRRHTRLDMDYLFGLCEALAEDRQVRRRLRFTPNSSLYRVGGRLRYVEARLEGDSRSHHLVAVDADDYLEDVLRRAAGGATIAELAAALAAREEVPLEDAESFVEELVDHQVLVSALTPAVTGEEPMADLLAQLAAEAPSRSVGECLSDVGGQLSALDARGLGNAPRRYREVAARLAKLPIEARMSRLLQVDLIKPAVEITLGDDVLAEIDRGLELLRRLTGPLPPGPLEDFCRRFNERYEGRRRIPLVEVLDEEVGIGFEVGDGAAASPLLQGLALPRPAAPGQVPWGARETMLLRRLDACRAAAEAEIDLTEEDVEALGGAPLPPLPSSFHVMATLAARSQKTLDRGELQVFLRHASGPSGARLLGRFCHADDALRRRVEAHLRAEEALEPEAIFAEVVHLPKGRVGNVLLRPLLRSHEIPFLGRSGAPEERQIPITDLVVSVDGNEVCLESRRLGQRVIPRLTSAHNFMNRSVGLYRFLCALQLQGSLPGVSWQWGPLDSATFLPRVRYGRLVLARARWRVSRRQIRSLTAAAGGRCFDAVQQWREERGLPRWVVLIDGDHELLVDLENVLSVETFLALARHRSVLVLSELFPAPEELCVRGPEGRFAHELVIPFVRHRQDAAAEAPIAAEAPAATPSAAGVAATGRRSFLPGSQWLYAKLYTGKSTADEVLTTVVRPLMRRLQGEGIADRWFFIRYGDPRWHLRLRIHGDPRRLSGEALPRLQATTAPLLADGRIWRLQLDTYERELERYGAGAGIALAEKLFHADSEAVARIVESFPGDDGAEARWLLAARGIDRLLGDLGFSAAEALELLTTMQSSFAQEFRVGPALRQQLAERLRRKRRALEAALEPVYDADHPLAPGFHAFERRSRQLAPIAAALRRAAARGRLAVPLDRLAPSFTHMFVNRLLRGEGRAHELVLYDFMVRVGRSRIARERGRRDKGRRGRARGERPRRILPDAPGQAAGGSR